MTWISDSPTASYIKCLDLRTKFSNSTETIISYAVDVSQFNDPQVWKLWHKIDQDIVTQLPATSKNYLLKVWSEEIKINNILHMSYILTLLPWGIRGTIIILLSTNPDIIK